MAVNWENSPLISEAYLNNQTYFLKDAEARAKIQDLYDTFVSTAFSFQIFETLPTAGAEYATTIALIASDDATLGPVCPGIPLAPSLPARPWNRAGQGVSTKQRPARGGP